MCDKDVQFTKTQFYFKIGSSGIATKPGPGEQASAPGLKEVDLHRAPHVACAKLFSLELDSRT